MPFYAHRAFHNSDELLGRYGPFSK
uniref:Uncharacterized protein n=1 Tax=Tetranychus urticae TaxID=32264 RepID=T1L658_TETUR